MADQSATQLLERIYLAHGGHGRVLAWASGGGPVERMASRLGVQVEFVQRNDDLSPPLERMAEAADPTVSMVFVSNPDNPTGYGIPMEELGVMAGVLPPDCLLVVDESYMDFTWPPETYSLTSMRGELQNLVIIRGLDRCRGLAGLPSTLASCPDWLADRLMRIPPAAPLTGLAETVAMAALADEDHHMANLEAVMQAKNGLYRILQKNDIEYLESQAPFVLFLPGRPALQVAREMLDRGVALKSFAGTVLEDFLRVSLGTAEEMAVFDGALSAVYASGDAR